MPPTPRSLVAFCFLLGMIPGPVYSFPAQKSHVPPPSVVVGTSQLSGIRTWPPQRRHQPLPLGGTSSASGGSGVVDVSMLQSYGVLICNAQLWPHPAKTQPAIRQVLQGIWVWIVGDTNGFYATILENGVQGWLPCSAVQLGSPLPSGVVGNAGVMQVYGVTTTDDNLYLQPAIQPVRKGSRVGIIGKRGDFYAVILENGRQGWLPSNKVQLSAATPSGRVIQRYGVVTIDSQLWPQPSVAIQPVRKGSRVQIVGQQGDCYHAILENGRQGWLRCDEVQLDTSLPSSVIVQTASPNGAIDSTAPPSDVIVGTSSSAGETGVTAPPSDMTPLPNGVVEGSASPSNWVGVPPPSAELIHNTNLWQQPTRAAGMAIQVVLKGSQMQIIGAQGDFYAVILENGRRGWLLRNTVQLITVLPNGLIEGADVAPALPNGAVKKTAPSGDVTAH